MKTKVLVLGGSSLFGRYFLLNYSNQFLLKTIQRRDWKEIDPNLSLNIPVIKSLELPNEKLLEKEIHECDSVINFLSDGRVNFCEENPEHSKKMNLDFALKVSEISAHHEKLCINFSTNVVFDGSNAPYSETSSLSPIGVYGNHKAELERSLGKKNNNLIVRTLFSYGVPFKNNFRSNPVFDLLKAPPTSPIKAVTDTWNNPIFAKDVASFLALAVTKNLSGIFNVAGSEKLSRFDLFEIIFKLKKYDLNLLVKAKDSDFPGPARPRDTFLDTSKANALGWNATKTTRAIEEMITELK